MRALPVLSRGDPVAHRVMLETLVGRLIDRSRRLRAMCHRAGDSPTLTYEHFPAWFKDELTSSIGAKEKEEVYKIAKDRMSTGDGWKKIGERHGMSLNTAIDRFLKFGDVDKTFTEEEIGFIRETRKRRENWPAELREKINKFWAAN